MKKKNEILKQAVASCAGPCYDLNLTKNIIVGTVHFSENETPGMPARNWAVKDPSIPELVDYFKERLPEEEQEAYVRFFDQELLLKRFAAGENHVCHRYWTGRRFSESIWVERHIVMYTDEKTGDVLGISYIRDITERYESAERGHYAADRQTVENDLAAANRARQASSMLLNRMSSALKKNEAELDLERQYLGVLCRDFTSVYHVDLFADAAVPLKLDSVANAAQMPGFQVRRELCYTEQIKSYCEQYVCESNQKEFLRIMERGNLLMNMKNTARYAYRYRSRPNLVGDEFFEVQVVRIREDVADGNVIIAFRRIDAVITLEQRHHQELEERFDRERSMNELLTAISHVYYAIFQIDLTADRCEEVYSHEDQPRLMRRSGMASVELGMLCERFVAPQDRERMRRFFDLSTIAERLRQEISVTAEYKMTDGNWHLSSFIVKRRDERGTATHILFVTRIVSDVKRREEDLISIAEDANTANQFKTEFISQIAHDIRTPLNSLCGFLEIAEANLDDPEKLRYSLGKIRVANDFLRNLVDDVLDISRMESGKMKLSPEKVSLRKVLEEFPVSMESVGRGKQLSFSMDAHDIAHDALLVDPLRLRQIYSNVLTNAVKYTPDGGKVCFEVYETEIPDSGKVHLTAVISDTGIGMSREFMEKMFSKFERATDTRVNKVSGYGLGLSIVKQLVEMMRGTFDVKSALGKGTIFRIELEVPFVEEGGAASTEKTVDYRAVCAGMHVLVAEDNELNREVLTELLQMHDITCDCTEDGLACVERFREAEPHTYDAILMDMQMPNMNGVDAARTIRCLPVPGATTTPIIAMTANALKEDVEECLNAGMNLHLSKPIDMEKLLKALAKFR